MKVSVRIYLLFFLLFSLSIHEFSNGVINLDVAKTMDKTVPEIEGLLEPQLSQFGQRKGKDDSQLLFDILDNERFTQNRGPLTEVRKT